jgi:hypothetical protein
VVPFDTVCAVGSTRILGWIATSVAALSLSADPAIGRSFRPRIGAAMGIVAPATHADLAGGTNVPVLFHGGSVMSGQVTIHTVFWAPAGYRFDGSPGGGVPGYESLVRQFFADVAHDSGQATNVFSTLSQYPDVAGPGGYRISYSAAQDSIDDGDPYPPPDQQCASPGGVPTCLTDHAVQHELNRVIQSRDPAGRGLGDVWLMLLPPAVDECTQPGACGTNTFTGYHSLSNLGRGPVIYAVLVDPLIEGSLPQGSDPQGNPEAEVTLDAAAHETVEAMSDPEGAGWMDPNGFEIGDKCEAGPQTGTPLGFAPDGSPYDQLIDGHEYLIQTIWSNTARGCVQQSSSRSSPLPLATVELRQFSSLVRGNIGRPLSGLRVDVLVVRAGDPVAIAHTRTRGGGSWGPVSLQPESRGGGHSVGDDRDVVLVQYGRGGPRSDVIETGNGGNPFTQSGWTGWFDLDHGYAVGTRSVQLAPCSQTGVLELVAGGRPTTPPIEQCDTESDVARVGTAAIGPGTLLTMSSADNRAVSPENPDGALVKLTIPLGEPGAVSQTGNDQVLFDPSGFPTCTADLRAQSVRCAGLVPFARYTLVRRRGHAVRAARAGANGVIQAGGFPGRHAVVGGDVLTLENRAGRELTSLHVAHLRVDITAGQTVVASGSCQPGDYYGPPPDAVPLSATVGVPGLSGTGTACPSDGSAAGVPTGDIAQTDDASGGQTRTEVPQLQTTSPSDGETVYGRFTALAQTGLPGPNGSIFNTGTRVALTIRRASGGRPVFSASNVNTAGGIAVRRLAAGVYAVRWVVIDANGDTRTVRTRFVEEG